MKFNKRITIIKEQGRKYNPVTGEHEQADPVKTTLPANVTNLSLERKSELFGSIDVNIITARTQRPISSHVDYVLFNGKRYEIKTKSNHRKGVLFLEGDGFED